MVTFWPGDSTCTPALTTSMPGRSPDAMTASLPSAVAICTVCDFTVMLGLSSTHTALAWPSRHRALVGSLITGCPCAPLKPFGTTDTVAPSGGGGVAFCSASLTKNVRVAGSALAATSRTVALSTAAWLSCAQPRTLATMPSLMPLTLSSGTEKTTSRGPSAAMRTTGAPAATTCPGSASIAVTMPATSAFSTA